MNKTQKAILIAVIAIIVGVILLLCAVHAVGGFIKIAEHGWELIERYTDDHPSAVTEDISDQDEAGDAIVRELEYGDKLQLADFDTIELNALACDVQICPATDSTFTLGFNGLEVEPAEQGRYLLIYQGGDKEQVTMELQDGVLKIDGGKLPNVKDWTTLRDVIRGNKRQLTILVPQLWEGDVTVTSMVGDLVLRDSAFGDVSVRMEAGDLDLKNASFNGKADVKLLAGDLELKSAAFDDMALDLTFGDLDVENAAGTSLSVNSAAGDLDIINVACDKLDLGLNAGELDMEDVACDKLKVKIDAGDFEFRGLETHEADIYCRLGNVSGTLKGSPSDYDVDCRVRMGESSVSDPGTGDRPVKVEVDMGSIDIDYRK